MVQLNCLIELLMYLLVRMNLNQVIYLLQLMIRLNWMVELMVQLNCLIELLMYLLVRMNLNQVIDL